MKLKNVFTKQEALRTLGDLKEEAEQHFFAGKEMDMEMLAGITVDNLEEEFKRAAEEIESRPELTIYLTFEPSDEEISVIGKEARALFGQNLFLTFKLDTALLGGAALAYGGIYKDYSLAAKFSEKEEELRNLWQKRLAL